MNQRLKEDAMKMYQGYIKPGKVALPLAAATLLLSFEVLTCRT